MFRKKKQEKKKEEQNQEEAKQLNSDLIVHNMPKASKLSGLFSSPSLNSSRQAGPGESSSGSELSIRPKSNFKMVGSIIIVGGLVFIGIIVYFSYRFIIFPATNQNVETIVTPTPVNKVVATSTPNPLVDVSPTTDLSAATTTEVSLTTTTPIMSSDANDVSVGLLTFPDSDGDSLNDGEEIILGTNATSTDTDSDSYSDSAEVLSGYNPVGSGKLNTNLNLATYTNAIFDYNTLYPKTWPVKALNNEATVIFTAPDDSLIQISTQDNSDQAGILSWYEESFPDITVTYDKVRSTYSWEGIMGADGLNFYLTDKKRTNIFVISYIPAVEGRIAYPNIFQLIINSLFIK